MTTAKSHPLDALWQAPAIVSVVLAGEGLALVLALSPGLIGDRWVYFGLVSLAIQWVILLTLGGLYLLRRGLAAWSAWRLAWLTLALLLLGTLAVMATSYLLLREIWFWPNGAWRNLLVQMFGIALVVGLFALVAFQNYWRGRQLLVQSKQAELEAVQARIRPHFLFNTLNTAAALVHQRPQAAEQVLLDLSELFRAALSRPESIPLAEEIELARQYLAIEALRLGERLQVDWQLPSPLPATRVPCLSLQPLVENAVQHGIEPLTAGGRVSIVVSVQDDRLIIRVANDCASHPARPVHHGHHLGQRSIRARLQALVGDSARLDTRVEGGRYLAEISLPI
ncbi:MAG: sensor histidine kinase [Lysobacterales bacterium]